MSLKTFLSPVATGEVGRMRKLLCLFVLVAFSLVALPAVGQGVSLQLCTNEDTDSRPGTCYRIRAVSSLAGGMGGTAGLMMMPVGALLYAHSAAGIPLVLEVGTGTSTNALRVVTASDSPGGSASTPSHVNVQEIGQNTVTAGAGVVTAGTQRTTLASDDPAVVAVEKMDDWDATHDSAASSDGPQVMAEAHTSQATAVDDGDAVRITTNEYGELVISGYEWTTDSNRVSETDPISAHHEESTLCDLTNIDTNTTDYCGYVDMDGYRGIGAQVVMSAAATTDTLTVTFECSLEDDGTAPASCAYEDLTNALFGVVNVVDADAYWQTEFVAAKYCRVKYVSSNDSGDDTDLTVYIKKIY